MRVVSFRNSVARPNGQTSPTGFVPALACRIHTVRRGCAMLSCQLTTREARTRRTHRPTEPVAVIVRSSRICVRYFICIDCNPPEKSAVEPRGRGWGGEWGRGGAASAETTQIFPSFTTCPCHRQQRNAGRISLGACSGTGTGTGSTSTSRSECGWIRFTLAAPNDGNGLSKGELSPCVACSTWQRPTRHPRVVGWRRMNCIVWCARALCGATFSTLIENRHPVRKLEKQS